MKKKRSLNEYRQTKDVVYDTKKPAAKKPAPKRKVQGDKVKMSVPPGLEFNKSYTPEEIYEAMSKAEKEGFVDHKSEAKEEFGTPSSPSARYEESEWVANPDLDIPTTSFSYMSKRELEILGRKYGVEIDRRLRKSTIIRIVESAIEMHRREQALLEEPMQKKLLQAIFIGIVIGLAIGTLFGYGLGLM